MPRPKKCRKVGFIPRCLRFTPSNDNQGTVENVIVTIEEVEAVRLSDLEGLEQSKGAEMMGISRGTYQRIINEARRKIADAIVSGKGIVIDGGCYKRENCRMVCKKCGNKWTEPLQEDEEHNDISCSCCHSKEYQWDSDVVTYTKGCKNNKGL